MPDHAPAGSGKETFDLRSLDAQATELVGGSRALGWVIMVFGVGMAISAAILLAVRFQTASESYLVALSVFLAAGVVIAVVYSALARLGVGYPTSLAVSESGVTLLGNARGLPREMLWKDPKIQLGLIDRRGLTQPRRDGRKRIPFGLKVRGSNWIPIPEPAYDAILHQAHTHHLSVKRQELPAPQGPGSYVKSLISHV